MLNPQVLQKFKVSSKGGPVIFIGELCEIFIPKRYEAYDALTIRDTVRTLGVFNMTVDGISTGMCAPSFVEIFPSQVETVNIGTDTFVKLTLKNGDTFLKTTTVVKQPLNSFPIYVEYVKSAKSLDAIPYEELSFIFDRMMKVSGISFAVDHAVYEMIFSHTIRGVEDITIPYRNTNMTGKWRQVPLTEIAHAATSTTGRIIGAYYNDGINAALNSQSDAMSAMEEILRR